MTPPCVFSEQLDVIDCIGKYFFNEKDGLLEKRQALIRTVNINKELEKSITQTSFITNELCRPMSVYDF